MAPCALSTAAGGGLHNGAPRTPALIPHGGTRSVPPGPALWDAVEMWIIPGTRGWEMSLCHQPVPPTGVTEWRESTEPSQSVLQPQPGPGRVLTWARGRQIGCSLRFGCQHQIHWPRSGSRGAIGGREFPGPGPAPRGLSPRWGPGCAEPKPPQALPLPRWSRAWRGGRGCAPPFHAGGGRWALGSGSAECSSADGGGKFQAVADGGRGMGSEGGPAWGQ